jgi:hypothetical protein
MLKFSVKPYSPQKPNPINVSSHNKYNRVRQGGWGKRTPLISEADLPFIDLKKMNLNRYRPVNIDDSLDMSEYLSQKK